MSVGERAIDRRGATRLKRRVPLWMEWGEEGCSAETHLVSESGALVLAPGRFVPGLIVGLRNALSGGTALARVVSCSEEPDPLGCWKVGVALLDQRRGFFDVPEATTAPPGRERRRSRRVPLGHPIELIFGRDAFPGRTQVVNRHGALVLSARDCPAGSPLWVRNLVSGRARPARVVRSRPPRESPGTGYDLAFEFEEPPRDFWGPDYAES
jgi:hypothetical protein